MDDELKTAEPAVVHHHQLGGCVSSQRNFHNRAATVHVNKPLLLNPISVVINLYQFAEAEGFPDKQSFGESQWKLLLNKVCTKINGFNCLSPRQLGIIQFLQGLSKIYMEEACSFFSASFIFFPIILVHSLSWDVFSSLSYLQAIRLGLK